MTALHNNPLLVILGPTASGKTSLAVAIAAGCKGEIISADSRQVYRQMDMGTGKDLKDYQLEGGNIPYHLIDIMQPGEKYNLFEYQRDFLAVYTEITGRGNLPLLCGGSGLYLEAVLKGYQLLRVPVNPGLREQLAGKRMEELASILASFRKLHNTTDIIERKRLVRAIEIEVFQEEHPLAPADHPDFDSLVFGLRFDRQLERKRITERLDSRLRQGLVTEVEGLLHRGIKPEQLIYYGLEYKFITLYLSGELSYDEMHTKLNTAIHQFAKRQMTWFRKMEREGFHIHWLKGEEGNIKNLETVRLVMRSTPGFDSFLVP